MGPAVLGLAGNLGVQCAGALGGFDGAGLAPNGACAGSGTVVPISVESNKADRAIWVGYSPWAMAIRP